LYLFYILYLFTCPARKFTGRPVARIGGFSKLEDLR
jgi:hypothetical protein